MRYRLLFVVLFIASLTASGCSHSASNNPLVLKQTSNGFTAQLTIPQDPVPVMKETTLTLTLHDPDGQSVPNASIRYDLTMPGMTMPPNQPQADEKDNGVYETKAIFTMAGNWRCRAEADVPGSTPLEFTFDFKAK